MWWRTEGEGDCVSSEQKNSQSAQQEEHGSVVQEEREVASTREGVSREAVLTRRERNLAEKERVVEEMMASVKRAALDLEERERELERVTRIAGTRNTDIMIHTLEKQLLITAEAASLHKQNEEEMRGALLHKEEQALLATQLLKSEITELSMTVSQLARENERLLVALQAQEDKACAFKRMSEEALHELKLKELEVASVHRDPTPQFRVRPFTLDKHTQAAFADPVAEAEVTRLTKQAGTLSTSVRSQQHMITSLGEALAELSVAAESTSGPNGKSAPPASLASTPCFGESLEYP